MKKYIQTAIYANHKLDLDEFCKKDKDLVTGLGIVKVSNMVTNNNLQFSTINGLDSIQKLIIGKFIKIINDDLKK